MQPPTPHPFTPGTRVMHAHAHTKGIVGGVLSLLVLVAIAIAVRKHKNNTNHNLPRRRAHGNGNVATAINSPGFIGTKVRAKPPQSPYSDEIYADIEEEIYACAGGEIQALNAQDSSAGARNSMAESIGDKLAKVIDGVVSMLASLGQPATRAEVARKLEATMQRTVPGGGRAKELGDAHRANADLQRKIAELQATRALPNVPGDHNASAGQGGGSPNYEEMDGCDGAGANASDPYSMPDGFDSLRQSPFARENSFC